VRPRIALVLAVVVLLAGAAAAWLLTRSQGSELGSVAEAVTAINDGGIECTGRKVLSRGEPKETGLCYVNGGEFEVDIYIFETVEMRDDWLQGLRDVYDREVVVGPNWYLTTGHRPLSDRIADALGAEVTE
jgi:hypothetical protein